MLSTGEDDNNKAVQKKIIKLLDRNRIGNI